MSFHFGKPIAVMILLSLLSGSAFLFHSAPPKADINLWVFADSHFRSYEPLIKTFESRDHLSVNMQLVQVQAENIGLMSTFMSGSGAYELPHLVEIEIG